MTIMDIRNRWKIIDSRFTAFNVAHDVRCFDSQCMEQKQSWQIELHFTEKAFETFKKELADITNEYNTLNWKPLSEDNPVFKGCNTEIVKRIVIASDYRVINDKQRLFIGEEYIERCIIVDKKYYSVRKYGNNKGYQLFFVIYTNLYNAYAKKIKFPEQPNFVNVMTPKKLKAWINYLAEIETRLEQKKLEIETKIADFKKKLRKVAPGMADERNGHITKNGIRYSWNLDDNGYTNEEIEIDISQFYLYDKIELFKMLSNNKFVPQKFN